MSRLAPVALAVLVGSALAAPVPKDFKPNDAKRIVGTWHVEEVHYDGIRAAEYQTNVFYTFDAEGGFAQSMTGEKNVFRRTFTLDPKAAPKRMAMIPEGGEIAEPWVYELTGDTLVMAYLKGGKVPDAVRPAKGLYVYTLSRVTADK